NTDLPITCSGDAISEALVYSRVKIATRQYLRFDEVGLLDAFGIVAVWFTQLMEGQVPLCGHDVRVFARMGLGDHELVEIVGSDQYVEIVIFVRSPDVCEMDVVDCSYQGALEVAPSMISGPHL